MKFCAYCGAKLEDDAKFCLICGEKCVEFLDENEEPSLEEEKLEEEKKAQEEAERLEQERLAEEARLKAEEEARLEAERLAKEEEERKAREEAERLEQERLEQERLEAERLEQERLEQERLEAERLEQERLAKEEEERLEQERLAELKKEEESQRLSALENEIASLKAQLAAQQQKSEVNQEPVNEGILLEEPQREEPVLDEPGAEENSLQETFIEEKKKDNFVLPLVALAVSLVSSIAYLLIKDLTEFSFLSLIEAAVVTLFTLIAAIVLLANRKINKNTKWLCIINILCCVGLIAFLLITWAGTFPGGGK